MALLAKLEARVAFEGCRDLVMFVECTNYIHFSSISFSVPLCSYVRNGGTSSCLHMYTFNCESLWWFADVLYHFMSRRVQTLMYCLRLQVLFHWCLPLRNADSILRKSFIFGIWVCEEGWMYSSFNSARYCLVVSCGMAHPLQADCDCSRVVAASKDWFGVSWYEKELWKVPQDLHRVQCHSCLPSFPRAIPLTAVTMQEFLRMKSLILLQAPWHSSAYLSCPPSLKLLHGISSAPLLRFGACRCFAGFLASADGTVRKRFPHTHIYIYISHISASLSYRPVLKLLIDSHVKKNILCSVLCGVSFLSSRGFWGLPFDGETFLMLPWRPQSWWA